jgi:hypothetical protein
MLVTYIALNCDYHRRAEKNHEKPQICLYPIVIWTSWHPDARQRLATLPALAATLISPAMLAYFIANATQLLTFSKCQVNVTAALEIGSGA